MSAIVLYSASTALTEHHYPVTTVDGITLYVRADHHNNDDVDSALDNALSLDGETVLNSVEVK